jgi:ribosomal protein L32
MNEKAKETPPQGEAPKFDLSTLVNNPPYMLIAVIALLIVILIVTLARRRKKPASQQPQAPTKYCPNCGEPLTPGKPLCSSCGQRA